ncbi:cell wall-binding repeat-containing protein, partial [Parafrigoribacterium humi]|uniref:cell wall-binding repeat-containing protein n=1 Tax=Parafrigoribacterium humi TaxID=3144664 RepID=UPI0032EB5907
VTPSGIPASIRAELVRLKPSRIVVVGGPASITDVVFAQLQQFAPGHVSRLAGADRYATSAAISAASFAPGVPVVYVASGEAFPDALSAAPVAGPGGGPVLLVTPSGIPASIRAELVRLKPSRIVVVGGPASITDALYQEFLSYVVK